MKLNTKKILGELKRLEWTRSEYARRIGISKQSLRYWLTDLDPKISHVTRMAKAFGLDPKDLLY